MPWGGAEMMATAANAVRKEFGDDRPRLLAVTILTSSTAETLRGVGIEHPVQDMVVRLAKLAQESGMDGVVASPLEIGLIRAACGPDFLIVTPGVRPSFASADDQKRIMTPAEAGDSRGRLSGDRPADCQGRRSRGCGGSDPGRDSGGVSMKGELIFGVNPVKESLQSTRGAFNLYVQISATDHRVEKVIKLAEDRGVAVHRREKIDLTKMCASSHHQGIALEVEPFRYAELDDLLASVNQSGNPGFLLVLDGILDPTTWGP